MKARFTCACGAPEWVVYQVGFHNGHIHCKRCDTRLVFELITIEYTA